MSAFIYQEEIFRCFLLSLTPANRVTQEYNTDCHVSDHRHIKKNKSLPKKLNALQVRRRVYTHIATAFSCGVISIDEGAEQNSALKTGPTLHVFGHYFGHRARPIVPSCEPLYHKTYRLRKEAFLLALFLCVNDENKVALRAALSPSSSYPPFHAIKTRSIIREIKTYNPPVKGPISTRTVRA